MKLRRFLAYVFDMLIISIIVSAFSNIYILNPKIDEYEKSYENYNNYVMEISQNNPKSIINDTKVLDLAYNLSYNGVYVSIITLVATFLYFSIFQYFTNGKTIGKLLLGIKVISTTEDKLKLSQIIIRSSIINSILTSSCLIISLLFLNKSTFINVNIVIQLIDIILIFTSIILILTREDEMGLHDILAKTKVVRNMVKESN